MLLLVLTAPAAPEQRHGPVAARLLATAEERDRGRPVRRHRARPQHCVPESTTQHAGFQNLLLVSPGAVGEGAVGEGGGEKRKGGGEGER